MPEILTDWDTPGERVPLDGLKVAPTSLLADQVMLPVELGSSVRVTVHGAVAPQVLESKLVGLTDHAGGTTGEGDGEGVGVGVRSEEHTSELQSHLNLVCRLLLEK